MTLFDPGEPAPSAEPRPSTRLGPVGQAILAYLREHEAISPLEAGLICHRLRDKPCGVGAKMAGSRSKACCGYTSTDGSEALYRLVRAGYVANVAHGRYVPTWRLPR